MIYFLTLHKLKKHYNVNNDGSVIWKEYGGFVQKFGTDGLKILGYIDLTLTARSSS